MRRPISPFLSIYKPQIGSTFSILERISGVFLLIGLLSLFIIFSFKNIFIFDYFYYKLIFLLVKGSLDSFIVATILYFYILMFVYHLLFSIRYLIWHWFSGDYKNFSLNLAGLYEISKIIVVGTVLLSLLIWLLI